MVIAQALKPSPVACVTTTKIDLFHSSTTKPNYYVIPSSKFFFNNSQSLSLPRNYENPVMNFTRERRIVTCSVSGLWDAITGGGDSTREALLTIRRGMQLFREGNVLESVVEFDKAIQLDPRQKAYLWQRGLSLYYLDRFEEGAEQFRIDVAQNPNDTEESIWCFLCEAQLYGVDGARKKFLEVGRDPRPVMREAYNLFKDGGDPEKLVKAFQSGRESDCFYASLYAGLYHECQGKADGAKRHIVAACESPYGQRSDDYMASLAKVHKQCRNWSP